MHWNVVAFGRTGANDTNSYNCYYMFFHGQKQWKKEQRTLHIPEDKRKRPSHPGIENPQYIADICNRYLQYVVASLNAKASYISSYVGRTISRVMSCTIIYLDRPLPNGSSDRPKARRAAV